MNKNNISKGLLLGASLLLASAAFAGEKVSVKVFENVKLNGKTLAPGKYQIAWDGTGSEVQLSIRQGKETVATLPATIAPSKLPAISTGYGTKKEVDGSKSITSFYVSGKQYTLELSAEDAHNGKATETAGNK